MGSSSKPKSRTYWPRIRAWAKALAVFVVLILGFIGKILDLADRPDQVAKLEHWIGNAMTDPRVHATAVFVSRLLGYLSLWWVQAVLLACAVMILLWRWSPFWRFRENVIFQVRRAVESQVWIRKTDALNLVRTSQWARLRRQAAEPPADMFSEIRASLVRDPAKDARSTRFQRWCDMALTAFGEANAESNRQTQDGAPEFDEVRLKAYLQERYDGEVVAEFGNPY